MASNQKTFTDVNEAEFEAFRTAVRGKGWAAPAGPSGMIRGGGKGKGLNVDVDYDIKASTLALRIRSVGQGDTYDSIFGTVETILKAVDR